MRKSVWARGLRASILRSANTASSYCLDISASSSRRRSKARSRASCAASSGSCFWSGSSQCVSVNPPSASLAATPESSARAIRSEVIAVMPVSLSTLSGLRSFGDGQRRGLRQLRPLAWVLDRRDLAVACLTWRNGVTRDELGYTTPSTCSKHTTCLTGDRRSGVSVAVAGAAAAAAVCSGLELADLTIPSLTGRLGSWARARCTWTESRNFDGGME
mmetsp:Transcript_20596/g.53541  ORF Transcript_20596/g.53541 Transcript_20596/m.53541 type:complete len:217 (-) Transcript_20596:939-1589(-)